MLLVSLTDGMFDFCQEIIITVYASWGEELGLSHIGGRITLAVAGCALLMALIARERTGADSTARAAVFRSVGIAKRVVSELELSEAWPDKRRTRCYIALTVEPQP